MTRSRTTMPRLAMASAAALLLVPVLALALMVPFSLDRLVADADTIVHGSVAAQDSHWDAAGRLIVTDVTVDVAETLKGVPASRRLLQITGGTVGDATLTMSEVPEFTDGEELIVFLAHDRVPARVVGLWQGKLTIENGLVTHAGRQIPVDDFLDEIRRRVR